MSKIKGNDSFWTSYSDLITSLFFVMLVLFIICIIQIGSANSKLRNATKEALVSTNQLENALNELQKSAAEAIATKEQLENILKLDEQFELLSKSSSLEYEREKKMFYAKDFQGIEIFNPFRGNNMEYASTIKTEYKWTVHRVGKDLKAILQELSNKNPDFKYQLVIEGTAAIPYEELISKRYDADSPMMYDLSYKRALALYQEWRKIGIDLRRYNTEIIIAGSGFNGINRDNVKEDNNKRFTIQIIPKISRPSFIK